MNDFHALIATRRHQLKVVVDSLDALTELADLVADERAVRQINGVDSLLAGARDEVERGRWAALIDRAGARIPDDKEVTPT